MGLFEMVDPGRVAYFLDFFLSLPMILLYVVIIVGHGWAWRRAAFADRVRAAEGHAPPRFGLCRGCSEYGPLVERRCAACRAAADERASSG